MFIADILPIAWIFENQIDLNSMFCIKPGGVLPAR